MLESWRSYRLEEEEGEHQLLKEKERKLNVVSNYYDERKNKVKKLSANVKCMNPLQLLWDSKVPEKSKSFYYCFSLTSSNRDHVLEEIKKYQTFYEELSNAVQKVRNPEVQTDDERVDPHGEIILALNETLSKMYETAKYGKDDTASSTIYKLHKSFIKRHETLEDMIMRVERVVLMENFKKASRGLRKTTQTINDLRNELSATVEKTNQMHETAGKLILNINELPERRDDLLKENQKTEEVQKALKESNMLMQEEMKKLLQSNKEMGKEKDILEEKSREMEKEQEKWQIDIKKMEKELENIGENYLKMKEEKEALEEKSKQMLEEKEKLLQKNNEMKFEKERLIQRNKEIEEKQEIIRQENEKMTEELKMKRGIIEEEQRPPLSEDEIIRNQMKRIN